MKYKTNFDFLFMKQKTLITHLTFNITRQIEVISDKTEIKVDKWFLPYMNVLI